MDSFNYGVQSLYIGSPLPYDGASESNYSIPLEGIQSANVSLTYPRQDMFDWAGGGNQEIVLRPRAQLDFSYIFACQANEAALGLTYSYSGYVAPALLNLNDERNCYLVANLDRADMVGYAGANLRTISIGNGVVSNYAFSAAVGQPTNVSVTIDALNALVQTGAYGLALPSVSKQSGVGATGSYSLPRVSQSSVDYYTATPKALQLSFGTGCAIGLSLTGNNSIPISSFGFSIGIPRAENKPLGWAYPDVRPVQWPVTISIRADAYVTQLQEDALNRLVCSDSGFDFTVRFKTDCTDLDSFSYSFAGAKLESQTFSSAVGSLNRVSLNWSLKIKDINKSSPNFYITPETAAFTSVIFPVEYTSGSSPSLTFLLSLPSYLSVVSGNATLSGNNVVINDPTGTYAIRATPVNGTTPQNISLVIT